jgi:hypothetical protein
MNRMTQSQEDRSREEVRGGGRFDYDNDKYKDYSGNEINKDMNCDTENETNGIVWNAMDTKKNNNNNNSETADDESIRSCVITHTNVP